MRYNPPPNWPTPPAGWQPPAGWNPDPSWGPPPPGWPLWIDDSAPSAAPDFVGDGLKWAWGRFVENVRPLIAASLLTIAGGFGVVLCLAAVRWVIRNPIGFPNPDAGLVSIGGMAIVAGLVLLVPAYLHGVLDIANGVPVTIRTFFTPRRFGEVALLGLMIGALSTGGALLCFIGSLAVSLFTMFAMIALLDRNLAPVDALKVSFDVVKDNFVPALLTWLVVTGLIFVGTLLFGVGLLVAGPLALLFEFYVFRNVVKHRLT